MKHLSKNIHLYSAYKLCTLHSNNNGSALLYVIASIVLIGAVGGGVAYFSSSSSRSQLQQSKSSSAYYSALSGKNYLLETLKKAENGELGESFDIFSLNTSYELTTNTQFDIDITHVSGNEYTYQVTGSEQIGNSSESNFILNSPGTFNFSLPEPNLGERNFIASRPGFAKFADDQTRDAPPEREVSDIPLKSLSLADSMTFGFGNIWYTGTKKNVAEKGVIAFEKGFRLFFTFKFVKRIGDGFTLAIINATNNNYLSSGGDSQNGELLGYAGDSRVYESGSFGSGIIKEYMDKSGFEKGLKPPKFAIEIDGYYNGNNFNSLLTSSNSCRNVSGFTNDNESRHIGFLFWGLEDEIKGKYCPALISEFKGNTKTYDDNVHGRGDNSINSGANDDLKLFNFLPDVEYHLRLDVKRKNNRTYEIITYLVRCDTPQCKTKVFNSSKSLFDTSKDYSPSENDLKDFSEYKQLYKAFTLTPTMHSMFDNIIWGYTTAAGSAVQNIIIRNESFNLRK